MTAHYKLARLGGFLYLLIIIFGLIAQVFVRDTLVNYRDASVTAVNILNSELWYRFGFVSELLMLVCDIGVTTILFILLKRTSTNLSILSTCFRLASIIILSVVALSHFEALSFLRETASLAAFNSEQLNAFALISIKLHGQGYNVSLFFFGFHLIALGLLIYRGDLFPRWIGILLAIGGVSYLTNSLIWFLFPDFVHLVYPVILIPCALGEWIFCAWLLIRGIPKEAV